MSDGPTGSTELVDESSETFCYGHPDTPTRLRCSRCDRPICGRCAIPASVGQHCPECVAEARRSTPKVRSAMAVNAPAVMAIMGVNVLMFFLQQFDFNITLELASHPISIHSGEWYRLLTPMVLHGGFLHLALNSFALWIYGPNVEQAYGTLRFLGMYVVAGFTGSAASYAFGSCNSLGVGASGAIFGILGALAVFVYNRRTSTFMAHYLRGVVAIVVLNLLIGFTIPQIDNFAHIGGLVGGALLGAGLDRPKRPPSPAAQLAVYAGVIALGIAVVAWRTSTFSCG